MEISNSCNAKLKSFKNSLLVSVRQYKTVSFDIKLNNKTMLILYLWFTCYKCIYIFSKPTGFAQGYSTKTVVIRSISKKNISSAVCLEFVSVFTVSF